MKRAIVDGWETDRALEEATALGLTNETLKQFFLAQIQQRKRRRGTRPHERHETTTKNTKHENDG